jgi:hypothetical protein
MPANRSISEETYNLRAEAKKRVLADRYARSRSAGQAIKQNQHSDFKQYIATSKVHQRQYTPWLDHQLRTMMNLRHKITTTQAKTWRGLQNLLLLQRGQPSRQTRHGAFAGAVRGRGRGGQTRAMWGGRGGGLQGRSQILDRLRNKYTSGYLKEVSRLSGGTTDVNKMYETHKQLVTDPMNGKETNFEAAGSKSGGKLLRALR